MVDFSGLLPLIGGAFVDWLRLFIAPLKNPDMLWIIVPIWGVWVFSEFFQEKKGTSFGNAITNGAVMLFVGVDWIRYILRQFSAGTLTFGVESATEIAISGMIILVSFAIILLGIKGHGIVKFIGRARESTYLLLMFTPVIYGVVEFNFRILATVIFFFPIFYVVVEIFDRVLPNPETFDIEEGEKLDRELGLGSDSNFAAQNSFPGQSDFMAGQFAQQRPPVQQPQLRQGFRKF
ncbi:hypothetical protein HYU18_03050 [Candidatus Woesearchaeota archaeon]|nr:hypothetical protein [Candidatus Woesearchaeota archaeon]